MTAQIGFDQPLTLLNRPDDLVSRNRQGLGLHLRQSLANGFNCTLSLDVQMHAILEERVCEMDWFLIFKFISNRPDDFFNNIFQCQKSSPGAASVFHQSNVNTTTLHLGQYRFQQRCLINSDHRPENGLQIGIWSAC